MRYLALLSPPLLFLFKIKTAKRPVNKKLTFLYSDNLRIFLLTYSFQVILIKPKVKKEARNEGESKK
ncbi:hypothetical protein DRJ04_03785 [Candidatus Aerophobetes bacterium]|uniref:Uncharacterized protein n=1 Tax=Aerophobetes bacterium TaxID=2030807 RepID=A0A662DFP7_UNCAE|nr:MAG: hypothetical protein DRJ04_03785 [Candidatus Aerophobetes bacterium]